MDETQTQGLVKELQDAVIKVCSDFFAVEQGNRLTRNNYQTFMNDIVKVFVDKTEQLSQSKATKKGRLETVPMVGKGDKQPSGNQSE